MALLQSKKKYLMVKDVFHPNGYIFPLTLNNDLIMI